MTVHMLALHHKGARALHPRIAPSQEGAWGAEVPGANITTKVIYCV
jgi:hypothetical protein